MFSCPCNKDIMHYAWHGDVVLQLHTFLMSALDGGEWSLTRHRCLTLGAGWAKELVWTIGRQEHSLELPKNRNTISHPIQYSLLGRSAALTRLNTTFRGLTSSPSSGKTDLNKFCLRMGTESVPETLYLNELRRLSAREDYIESCRRESFKT
jgi:hypothetical protein